MAGAAGVRPFASAAVMPQTETGTYLWCRKVVESQFDSCQQQSRRTEISAPYVRFFGEDMHGITVFASLPGNPDTPSMAVSACEKNVIPRTYMDQIENGDSMLGLCSVSVIRTVMQQNKRIGQRHMHHRTFLL